MKVKSRSVASISKWGRGRCEGKMKGIKKRVEYVAQAILMLDNINLLSDEILLSLFDIAIKLLNEDRKIYFRILVINGSLQFKADDLYFDKLPYIYDWCFNRYYLHKENIYNRYKKLECQRKLKLNE